LAQAKVSIDGMSCMHCVGRVKQAVDALEGVTEADVQIGNATVTYDEAKLSQTEIEAAIEKSGYKLKK
jgi:copper chaperone